MSQKEQNAPLFQHRLDSPLGPLTLQGNETAITHLQFGDLGFTNSNALLQEAEAQLQAYLSGKLQQFQLPLHSVGTAFQLRVWSALQEIPYGKMISYRELSDRIGAERAYRAVGNANGKNPLPILIPCHRVISHNGTLGGYSGGLSIKKSLLALEGHSF